MHHIREQHSGGTAYIPTELAHSIARNDDIERLKEWREKCDSKSLGGFLDSFCEYCAKNRKLPSRQILIEVDSIRDEVDNENLRDVDTLLLIGFWADEMKPEVDKQFKRITNENSGAYLPEVAQCAMRFGFPELAIRVAESIDDQKERKETLLSFNRMRQGKEFTERRVDDKTWLDAQPKEVQASLKMLRAEELLKALKEKK